MAPPSAKLMWWPAAIWAVTLALTTATFVMRWERTLLGTAALVFIPVIGVLTVTWIVWLKARTLARYRASPHGLCSRCERPLPVGGGAQEEVTCPECGIVRTRAEQRRDWARWFSDLK